MERTRIKTVNTDSLWEQFASRKENLIVENGLRLKQTNTYEHGKLLLHDSALDIRDIAVDLCDIIYVIDRRRILSYDKEAGTINELGCYAGVLPVILNSPSGIALDHDTIYVADSAEDQTYWQVVALGRGNHQVRWILAKDLGGEPLKQMGDLVVSPDELVYALERGGRRVVVVDRGGKIRRVIGEAHLSDPTDLAVTEEGHILVLDGQHVHVFGVDGTPLKSIAISDFVPSGLCVDRHNNIFLGESGPDHPLKTIHHLRPDGQTTPLWSYRGAVRRLINDSKGHLYVINEKRNRLTFLANTQVNCLDGQGLYRGVYLSKALDSCKAETRWHRYVLEGHFPRQSHASFSYYASDTHLSDQEIQGLPDAEWQQGLSELSFFQGETKRDALFQGKILGRYLWFRLALTGDRDLSPHVNALTLFFPRSTYVEQLPAVYREDRTSFEFLERFVSIFESLLSQVDFKLEKLTRYLDACGAPMEFLTWLGSWLAVAVDEKWPEEKKRGFLEKALSFYKKRGTRAGLEEMIAFYTGQRPYIVECFQKDRPCQRQGPVHVPDALFFPPQACKVMITGDDGTEEEVPLADILFGRERFSFCVFLKEGVGNQGVLDSIRHLIEEQKPAHTSYGLEVLQSWFYLDMHTYLEVNTRLTKPVFVLGSRSVLGRDSMLQDRERAGQIERHSRIGIDTVFT